MRSLLHSLSALKDYLPQSLQQMPKYVSISYPLQASVGFLPHLYPPAHALILITCQANLTATEGLSRFVSEGVSDLGSSSPRWYFRESVWVG